MIYVIPTGKEDGASFTTLNTPQLSAVTGIPRFTPTAVQPLFVTVEISAGAVIVGFTTSFIVTVCVAVAAFPLASVAVHVIVVVPTG